MFHGQYRRSSVFCLEYVEGEGQRAIALTDGRQQTGCIGIRIRRTKEEGYAVFDAVPILVLVKPIIWSSTGPVFEEALDSGDGRRSGGRTIAVGHD